MIALRINLIILFLIFLPEYTFAKTLFGETLCKRADYFCILTKSGDTWLDLFPNPEERDIIKRANRLNIELKNGMTLAIPKNLDRITIYDISPFPKYIEPTEEKIIYINQKELAWGAYDETGELIWWGPLSSGTGKCSQNGRCITPCGYFRVIRKQDIDCISTAFPQRSDGNHGGAQMPYCMHFFRGYALHGSDSVPGYKASHGCVRMFTEDARWLNEEFIDIPGYGLKGTRVVVGSITD